MASENETSVDILAEMRIFKCRNLSTGELKICAAIANFFADRIEAAWKRERERDERLLFRLLWFDVDDYQSDWACNAYRQTIKDCCARLGIPYHESGREIDDEMEKSKLGVEMAREVCDE